MPRPTSPISTSRASAVDARWRVPISSITALAAFGKRASLPSYRAAALVFVPDEPVMMRRAGTMYELVSLVSIARPTGGRRHGGSREAQDGKGEQQEIGRAHV